MRQASNARERLINSAVHLLHAGSYGSVSVNDLCAHAGVNKGSFYHFFPSKRDLVLAAIEAQWELYRRDIWDKAFVDNVPPLERFTRFFTLAASFHAERAVDGCQLGCAFGNLGLEMATQDPVIRERIRDVFDRMRSYLERTLEDARAVGLIGQVDVRMTALRLLTYIEGVCLMSKVHNDAEVFVRLGRGAIQLVKQAGDSTAG